MEAQAEVQARATRRERFRGYMASVDPAENPLTAIERRVYVPPPRAIANQMVARFEIEPRARELVVGGVGSGKTTQLWVCTQNLNEVPDIAATYIDVSVHQNLSSVAPGCLVALAACELLARANEVDTWLSERLKGWAHGYEPDPWSEQSPGGEPWIRGVVSPPQTAWPTIDRARVDDFKVVVEAFVRQGKHPIFLFDSLDRMTDYEAFSRVVEEDVAALHASRVGVVLVGPLRSLAGFGRVDADRFDHLHVEGPVDVAHDASARRFLESVLEHRACDEILPAEVRSELALWSGGVLRDLLSLAKLAGEEAYLDGAESISKDHAIAAADRLGRSLLIGLEQLDLDKLKQVQDSGRFVPVSPSDVAPSIKNWEADRARLPKLDTRVSLV